MLGGTDLQDADRGSGRTTAASLVCARIRQDILAGRLAPGEKLKVDAIRERYGATINPAREALNRLVSEGLVDVADQRGFSVAPVSLDGWRDLVHTRCVVEGAAVREAILRRTEAWEDEIVLSLHRLRRTPRFAGTGERRANPEWETAHGRFHGALIATCGSSILRKFCADLGDRATRYRHIASIAPTARTDYDDEHQRIADACIAGEADRAAQLLADHYRITLGVVEAYFREIGDAAV